MPSPIWCRPAAVLLPAALLFTASRGSAQQEPVPVLLVSGANNHDWKWTSPEIQRCLEETGRFAVTVTDEPAKTLADGKELARYRAFVLNYNGPRWGAAAEQAFLAAVEKGAGVVVIHAADNAFSGWAEYEKLVGLLWRDGTGHGAYHPFDVAVVDHQHPITRGMPDMVMHPDELYHRLVWMHGAEVKVLLSAWDDPKTGGTGRYEPMATVGVYGAGRVFHTPLGHTWEGVVPSRATWHDPQLRNFVARGTEWAATGAVTLPPRPPNWLDPTERAEGFQLLFDGKALDGWRGYKQDAAPAKGWSVTAGAIVHQKGGGGDLVTRDRFGDCDFRFEWCVGTGANSGVIWRVQETEQETYMTGPEYQVFDDLAQKPDGKHGAGALYDLVPATGAQLRPAGQWNDGRIVLAQGRVQHWLNGVKVVDAPCAGPEWDAMVKGSKFRDWPFGKAAEGHFALQDHGDEVRYRSLRVRRL